MNRFDIGRCHYLSLCNPPRARKILVVTLMTMMDGQHIRQFSL